MDANKMIDIIEIIDNNNTIIDYTIDENDNLIMKGTFHYSVKNKKTFTDVVILPFLEEYLINDSIKLSKNIRMYNTDGWRLPNIKELKSFFTSLDYDDIKRIDDSFTCIPWSSSLISPELCKSFAVILGDYSFSIKPTRARICNFIDKEYEPVATLILINTIGE